MSIRKYLVRQHYVVEVEVEAESREDARIAVMDAENIYTVTATFDTQAGGPSVTCADIDDEILEADYE